MLNQANEWVFVNKPSRPALSEREVAYWKQTLKKLLKIGIEVEYNLPDKNGTCDRQNFLCECVSVFKPKKTMPNTKLCYEQCANWDNGNCEIAKEHGCAGINCYAFKSPCPSCNLYDRGCNSCPELYDIRRNPKYIRSSIGKALKPTRFVGKAGSTGTYKVCRDGSLLGDGGVEVATVGRRVQFQSLYDMINQIIDETKKHGAYTNERCSIHVHLLASYLSPHLEDDKTAEYLRSEITEMEQPMPEVILANFHQLIRRYQAALVWLSAAGQSKKHITRWEKFRKSILPYSAVQHRMPIVVQEVASASKSKLKYAFVNYAPTKFNSDGMVSRLHVEGRYMDGMMSPAAIVAQACLLYGLMIKAVEISRHGILQSGNKAYMDLQKEIYKNLCNNDGDYGGPRHSNTSRISPYIPDLVRQATQLIRLVKGTLSEQAPADEILKILAEKPLAYFLMEGYSWEQIENELLPGLDENRTEVEETVDKIIDLGAICECDDDHEWLETASYQVAEDMGVGTDEEASSQVKNSIQEYVRRLNAGQKIFWSKDVGGYLRAR